jgi:PAS domain-containing protein
MTKEPSTTPDDSQEEIARLVLTLHETQQRLQELTGGEVDAVILPGGHSYLLHEAQEKLRRSEAHLRQIIDLVPVYIFAKDRAGRFLLANQVLAAAYGKTPAEVEGRRKWN